MGNGTIEAFEREIFNQRSDLIDCIEETMKRLDSKGEGNYVGFMDTVRKMKSDRSLYEIRATLRALSRIIKPKTYLEIGTRRGWSLAQVLAETPSVKVLSFDLWVKNYASAENPGPAFVKSELKKITGRQTMDIEFISGNSHDTIPEYFEKKKNMDIKFDLVTVDGDHTLLGAWWDLLDVIPMVSVGGAVVFDDLGFAGDEEIFGVTAQSKYAREPLPLNIKTLTDVWNEIKKRNPNFIFIDNLKGKPPVGFGLRIS